MTAITGEAKRTSYQELFFDLVFVFAITQLAAALHADHSVGGWGRAGLVAWLVWWAWSQYTWAGNAIDVDRRLTRVCLLAVAGLVLLSAAAIPTAFGEEGAWFALPYATVRFAGLGLYWAGLRTDPDHRAALRTYLPVASISPALVLAGGIASPGIRTWVWVAAVAIDVASVVAAGKGDFRVAPGHFAERHALIVIIAIGESVIAVGATASEIGLSGAVVATALAGFVIVATLWWAYFDWVHATMEGRLTGEADNRRRGHLARDLFTLAHFPIVAGPVVFAVGVEEAIVHPGDPLPAFGRLAVATGVVLFLGGMIVGYARSAHRLLVERLVAAATVAGIVAVSGERISALAVLGAVAVALLVATGCEAARRRVREDGMGPAADP